MSLHRRCFRGRRLDDYRILVPQLPGLLSDRGVAIVEIGWTQAEAVSGIARTAGMTTRVHHDLAGRKRAVEMAKMANIPLGKGPADH